MTATQQDKDSKVLTGMFRVSYPHIWKPQIDKKDGRKSWSVTAVFPFKDLETAKADPDFAKLITLFQSTKSIKLPGQSGVRSPFKLGNGLKKPEDPMSTERWCDTNPEYKDSIFIQFKSYDRPILPVNADMSPILDQKDFYAGCFAVASVNAFAYNRPENKGVSFGLCTLVKVREGEPLTAVHKAEVDFAGVDLSKYQADNAAELSIDDL